VVADAAGLDFNHYAARMLPVAASVWIVSYLVLRRIFRSELASAPAPEEPGATAPGWTRPQWQGIVLVLVVLGAYPVVSYFDGSVWVVASTGAIVAIAACAWHRGRGSARELVLRGVSWEILVFLFGVFLLALGLRNAGLVADLSELYEGAGVAVVGLTSALGSALINNHSMALTNLLALEATPGSGTQDYLAALIGGDLGPRLLPMGSLAGLLWFMSLRRLDIEVPVKRFVTIGFAVTVPSLAVSLGLLALVT
jgi:arsenical pump membrane protein